MPVDDLHPDGLPKVPPPQPELHPRDYRPFLPDDERCTCFDSEGRESEDCPVHPDKDAGPPDNGVQRLWEPDPDDLLRPPPQALCLYCGLAFTATEAGFCSAECEENAEPCQHSPAAWRSCSRCSDAKGDADFHYDR